MALDQAAVLAKLRTVLATVTGLDRVYTQGLNDANRMPSGIVELPAAIIFAGPTLDYRVNSATHQHTYEAHIDLLEGGADFGEAAYNLLLLQQRCIEAGVLNLKLGALVTVCRWERSTGLIDITWADVVYRGHRMTYHIIEHASAAPAPGS